MALSDVFKKLNRIIGQKVKRGERQIARRFAHTLADIRLLLTKVYEDYEVDGKVTWENVAKYNRFNKMMAEINFLLKRNYADVAKIIPGVLGELYKDGYHLTAFGVEQAAKAKLKYATASIEQIEAAMTNPVTKLTPRIWAEFERGFLVHRIQQTITQGFVNGSTFSTMSKALKEDLNVAAYKTMRVVRTEGHRVSESAKLEAVEHADKQGVKMMKTWNTLNDLAVRRKPQDKADHVKLDGVTIPTDELFDDGLSAGPAPGLLPAAASSINCRCFLTYSIEKVDKPQHDELEKLTFDKWEKERLKG